jgi:hypothetical protein
VGAARRLLDATGIDVRYRVHDPVARQGVDRGTTETVHFGHVGELFSIILGRVRSTEFLVPVDELVDRAHPMLPRQPQDGRHDDMLGNIP